MQKIVLAVLSIAVIVSVSGNFLQYRANQEQVERLSRPLIQEWLVRLDIKSITIAESGENLTDRALGLIQKEIWMDIGRIRANQESLSPALKLRFQTSLGRLAEKFKESPEIFSESVFYDDPSIRAAYLAEIAANDS